jgi:hypothetical protein
MFVSSFRRSVLVLAAVAATAAPSAAIAADNGSTGTGDSDICQTLLDRVKRYHAISKDKSESQAVRNYYAAQAQLALFQAKRNNCSWVAISAGHLPAAVGGLAIADQVLTPKAPAAAVRVKGTFDRLDRARKARRSARIAGGAGGTRPTAGATVSATKANPTGNPSQDEYCSKAAELIDEAYDAGDAAYGSGDEAGGDAWYDLANEFVARATANGCRFTISLRARGLRLQVAQHAVATRA